MEETVAEADLLVSRCRVRATHAGSGLGIEATNRAVEFTDMMVIRLREGRIIENWYS